MCAAEVFTPAVSIITTGPRGKISIDLETESVVVPFTSETIERFWLTIAFTKDDFPLLVQPKKAICGRSDFCNCIFVF